MIQTLKDVKIILISVLGTIERFSAPYKTYFGEDAINKFLKDMVTDSGYCPKVIKTQFDKPRVITDKYHGDFHGST